MIDVRSPPHTRGREDQATSARYLDAPVSGRSAPGAATWASLCGQRPLEQLQTRLPLCSRAMGRPVHPVGSGSRASRWPARSHRRRNIPGGRGALLFATHPAPIRAKGAGADDSETSPHRGSSILTDTWSRAPSQARLPASALHRRTLNLAEAGPYGHKDPTPAPPAPSQVFLAPAAIGSSWGPLGADQGLGHMANYSIRVGDPRRLSLRGATGLLSKGARGRTVGRLRVFAAAIFLPRPQGGRGEEA